jgi:hypothetical protein
MSKRTYKSGSQTAVAQVWKGTITTTTNGHTYIVTLTDESGGTVAITYVVANPPDTTVTLVATGFITAWNASTDPRVAAITATQNAGQVILTADTAGVPFYAAQSGTGTWSGAANTQNNVSSIDFNDPLNIVEGVAVAAGDDVFIASGNITYGLRQTANVTANWTVLPGHSGTIGGDGRRFTMAPTSLTHEGTGQTWYDIGSANISPRFVRTASASSGQFGVNIIGSNIATLRGESGSIGVAPAAGETATVATVVNAGATIVLGTGVTLTTYSHSLGTSEVRCAATTISADSGNLVTVGSGAVTTFNNNGASVVSNSSGTITTFNQVAGTLDTLQSRVARTITSLAWTGGTIKIDTAVVTLTNKVIASGHLSLSATAA